MRKKSFYTTAFVMAFTLALQTITVFAYNADNPDNKGKYYAFNQFYIDHFTGCANGDVDYLSHYNDKTTPLASGSAHDRMQYIADNEWIPMASYSPSTNVMNMYFCGEQNLDYTDQAIQIAPNYANNSLADAITGLSESDIQSLLAMTETAGSFNFYLDYIPEKATNQSFPISSVYKDFGSYIKRIESKKINVEVGSGATLKLSEPINVNNLLIKAGAILDLSQIKGNDLSGFTSWNMITSSNGIIVLSAEVSAEQREHLLSKVYGSYVVILSPDSFLQSE